jgi:hypothetical protein
VNWSESALASSNPKRKSSWTLKSLLKWARWYVAPFEWICMSFRCPLIQWPPHIPISIHCFKGAAKIMAKDLVRTRKHVEKMYKMKTQLQTVSLRLQTIKSQHAMASAMAGVTKVCSTQFHFPLSICTPRKYITLNELRLFFSFFFFFFFFCMTPQLKNKTKI